MSANTKIEWADHTFNPWIGCTQVSPGCDNCYAKAEWEGRRVAWLVREVEAWAESRPVSDLAPPPNTGARKSRVSRHRAPASASA